MMYFYDDKHAQFPSYTENAQIMHFVAVIYVGLSHSSISRLQLVQNAAARFLTGTSRREHITPVLSSLHWLPVRFRIDFKLLFVCF